MTMDSLANLVSQISDFVWNGLLLYLLVGTGIIFSFRTRFVQVRKFGAGFKRLFGSVNLNGEKADHEACPRSRPSPPPSRPRSAPATSPGLRHRAVLRRPGRHL